VARVFTSEANEPSKGILTADYADEHGFKQFIRVNPRYPRERSGNCLSI
jgi:hypothetical protein